MKAGDYVIDDEIVIERKTTWDFVQSIIDGRLFKQVAQMKQRFDCAAIIIEGKNLYHTSIDIHPHAVKGALISVALAWRLPVLFFDEKEDTALLLSSQLLDHFGTVENVIVAPEDELMQIPRLGKIKAKMIREVVSK